MKVLNPLFNFFGIALILSLSLCAEEWYSESYFPNWRQEMKIDRVLFREQTDEQDLVIFENEK